MCVCLSVIVYGVCVCQCVFVCVYVSVCVCVSVCMSLSVSASVCISMCVCLYVCVIVCVWCVYLSVCVCVCEPSAQPSSTVGHRIDPSQWTQLQFGLFSVPTSGPQLVYQRPWYVLFCLWKSAYKRSLAAYRKE